MAIDLLATLSMLGWLWLIIGFVVMNIIFHLKKAEEIELQEYSFVGVVIWPWNLYKFIKNLKKSS